MTCDYDLLLLVNEFIGPHVNLIFVEVVYRNQSTERDSETDYVDPKEFARHPPPFFNHFSIFSTLARRLFFEHWSKAMLWAGRRDLNTILLVPHFTVILWILLINLQRI